tara:strand:- start:10 stop:612 length:603 start_codon:yes stop_codon:yes gene_type:complete
MFTLIYDFETSGLNPYHEDVIEIGCKCLETEESFTCLIQPLSDKLIDKTITSLTGITNKQLKKDGLVPKLAFIKFFDFLQKHYDNDNEIILIAHNGRSFDDIFLKRIYRYLLGEEISKYDSMMNRIYLVDSLLVCKYLYPERYSHSMKNMCQLLNIINESEHRSMGDVNSLSLIWTHITKIMNFKKIEVSGTYLQYITCY